MNVHCGGANEKLNRILFGNHLWLTDFWRDLPHMKTPHIIDPARELTLETVQHIIDQGQPIALGKEAEKKILACRNYLDSSMSGHHGAFYGINTGFGSLCDTIIPDSDLSQLQRNLLLSHACGMGEPIPREITRRILLLKIQGLSYGHSGVQLETVQRLCDFYNNDLLPVVFEQGSLGASGDLAPLAHLALPLIGEGLMWVGDKMVPSSEVL